MLGSDGSLGYHQGLLFVLTLGQRLIECLQNGNGMQVNRGWNASKLEMKCKQTRNEIQANQKPWEWTSLMSISDKLQLRKRAIIETINDELKNMVQVE